MTLREIYEDIETNFVLLPVECYEHRLFQEIGKFRKWLIMLTQQLENIQHNISVTS